MVSRLVLGGLPVARAEEVCRPVVRHAGDVGEIAEAPRRAVLGLVTLGGQHRRAREPCRKQDRQQERTGAQQWERAGMSSVSMRVPGFRAGMERKSIAGCLMAARATSSFEACDFPRCSETSRARGRLERRAAPAPPHHRRRTPALRDRGGGRARRLRCRASRAAARGHVLGDLRFHRGTDQRRARAGHRGPGAGAGRSRSHPLRAAASRRSRRSPSAGTSPPRPKRIGSAPSAPPTGSRRPSGAPPCSAVRCSSRRPRWWSWRRSGAASSRRPRT